MRSDFRQAVEHLYLCFPSYGNIHNLEEHSCPHCRLGEQIRPLLVDRSVIDPEHLAFYSMKAVTTCGTVEHFKHFLPRMLETCDAVARRGSPLEWIGGKLTHTDWRNWPLAEVEAIKSTLVAILNEAVGSPSSSAVADCYELLTQAEWIDWLLSLDSGNLIDYVTQSGDHFLFSNQPRRYLEDMRVLDEHLGPGKLGHLLEKRFFDLDGDEALVVSNVHLLLDRHEVMR